MMFLRHCSHDRIPTTSQHCGSGLRWQCPDRRALSTLSDLGRSAVGNSRCGRSEPPWVRTGLRDAAIHDQKVRLRRSTTRDAYSMVSLTRAPYGREQHDRHGPLPNRQLEFLDVVATDLVPIVMGGGSPFLPGPPIEDGPMDDPEVSSRARVIPPAVRSGTGSLDYFAAFHVPDTARLFVQLVECREQVHRGALH